MNYSELRLQFERSPTLRLVRQQIRKSGTDRSDSDTEPVVAIYQGRQSKKDRRYERHAYSEGECGKIDSDLAGGPLVRMSGVPQPEKNQREQA